MGIWVRRDEDNGFIRSSLPKTAQIRLRKRCGLFLSGRKTGGKPLPNYLMVFYVLFDDVVDNPQFQQSTDYKKSSQKRSMHLKRFYPLENSSPNRLISRFLSRSASFC